MSWSQSLGLGLGEILPSSIKNAHLRDLGSTLIYFVALVLFLLWCLSLRLKLVIMHIFLSSLSCCTVPEENGTWSLPLSLSVSDTKQMFLFKGLVGNKAYLFVYPFVLHSSTGEWNSVPTPVPLC